ncbi:hypothetical protein [Noviherbaspirillum malthae]|uniref:hypothetical protein n=1 Tax=Noviherbaspirillum malthae TaxID=1260987 RepID=UPI0018904E18|nr:hypothetical protein [Noviherbaspirillum malthae]
MPNNNEVGFDLASEGANGLGRIFPHTDGAGGVQSRLAQACEAFLEDGAEVGPVFFRQVFRQRAGGQDVGDSGGTTASK